ncbi:hypothetical protein VB620_19280 [Nodularia harveyana UHCC-0300]|uniref:LemA family protein n=1 Tax=Nodularia harveyana UHCC-0300 TaxID=2974287 RepID=A0ABU5UJ26_9CYAN|nr:hypothetical protein [Nodularia harveyana]MEA5583474.1 hypothetical protein [Nodularia harveyana UHCC-0300]
MVTTVVVINTLISLVLLYIAWRVWKLKQWIGYIADKLNAYERNTHEFLYQAPENIDIAQQKIYSLRQRNQKLQVQVQQVRQIISLLLLGKRFWGRSFGKIELTSTTNTVSK